MRLVRKYEANGLVSKVYRNAEYDEYVVKTFKSGQLEGTYHTQDKDDAFGTAEYIVNKQ